MLLLLLSLITKAIFIFVLRPTPSYDEMAILLISKEPVKVLLNTVLSERFHPPGFYLFLKLLPTSNFLVTKLILSVINSAIIIVALYWGYKTNLVQRLKLTNGLFLFFISFVFVLTSSEIKQDMLSFPFFFAIFLFLNYLHESINNTSKRVGVVLSLLLTALLFTAYVNYLFAIGGLFLVLLKNRDKISFFVFFSQLILCLSYAPYALLQFKVASVRYLWTLSQSNNLFTILSRDIQGITLSNIISLAFFIVYVSFFVLGLLKNIRERPSLITKYLMCIVLLLPVFYLNRIFIQERYTSFLFFIFCVFAGFGLEIILNKKKFFRIVLFVGIYFFVSLMYTAYILQQNFINTLIVNTLQKSSANWRVGFVTSGTRFQLVYKLYYFNQNKNIIPVSPYSPSVFESAKELTKENQTMDLYGLKLSSTDISGLLIKNNISTFIYLYTKEDRTSVFDRNDTVLKALMSICKMGTFDVIESKYTIFIFKECKLNDGQQKSPRNS